MRPPRLCLFAAYVCVVGLGRAASFDDRVEMLFRPPLGEMITLSPDGHRVAYATHSGRNLAIVLMSVEPPGPRKSVTVEPPRRADATEEPPPMQLRFLRWATPSRVVFAPIERVVPLPAVAGENGKLAPNPDGPTIVSPIMAMDADGKQRGVLVDASDFMETADDARKTLADLLRTTQELVAAAPRKEPARWRMPHLDILGFFPRDREQLILQTHGGYGIPRQHLLDIRTGGVREFGGDWPAPPGEPQVFDWFRFKVVGERKPAARAATEWRDDELGRMQRELEAKFPRRTVEILDWSETRARVLCRVTGGSDAGRIFVFQRPENLVFEVLRRAPWLPASRLHETRFFEFAAADGAQLSGYLTWPAKPRLDPPPLLTVLPSGFPGRAQPPFDPEAQVFADLGFAVLRLNHRSVGGVRPEDLNPLRRAVDRVAVDDAKAAVDWIAARNPARPFDRKRIATLGRGFGGYLAVRALQLQPGVFRCGIAIDAPMELRGWLQPAGTDGGPAAPKSVSDIPAALFDHGGADWKNFSVLEQAEGLKHPVLFLVEPARSVMIDTSVSELCARLKGLGRTPEQHELDAGFAAAVPASRAAAYRRMEEFFNQHLPGYAVKIGPAKEVE